MPKPDFIEHQITCSMSAGRITGSCHSKALQSSYLIHPAKMSYWPGNSTKNKHSPAILEPDYIANLEPDYTALYN